MVYLGAPELSGAGPVGRSGFFARDRAGGSPQVRGAAATDQPDLEILSRIRRHDAKHKDDAPTRPLTAASLVQVCGDPKLGFVISPENVGFDPLPHSGEGPWKSWNLYDCRRVRL